MKKALLFTVICLITCQAMAQLFFEPAKKVYKSPNLDNAVKTHHLGAIVPLDARISFPKQPKHLDSAELAEAEMWDKMYRQAFTMR